MEKIVINGMLYSVKDGTNEKIRLLLHEAEKSHASLHENGTAYSIYNAFLNNIIENKKGIYIDNIFQTS